MVARQFRVLEAASSSPATSTKNTGIAFAIPVFLLVVYRVELALRSATSRIECANFASERVKLACRQREIILPQGKAPATLMCSHIAFLYVVYRVELALRVIRAGSSALISQVSASSSLVSRTRNYFAARQSPRHFDQINRGIVFAIPCFD